MSLEEELPQEDSMDDLPPLQVISDEGVEREVPEEEEEEEEEELPALEPVDLEIGEMDELNIEPPPPISRASRDLPPQAIAPKARSLTAPVEERQEDDSTKITVKEWANDPVRMDLLRDFFESRYGEEGVQKTDETDEEYFEKFLTYKRALENNFINLGQEVDWIRRADVEDRDKLVDLYIDVENNIPNFYEEGGGDAKSALFDYFWYNISDPILLLTGGIGKFFGKVGIETVKKTLIAKGRRAALEEAKKIGFRKGVIIGAGVEGTGEAARNIGTQRVQQAHLDLPDVEIDAAGPIISGLMTSAIAGPTYGSVVKGEYVDLVNRKLRRKKELSDARKEYKKEQGDEVASDKIVENINRKQQDELIDSDADNLELINPIDGKKVIDDLANVDNLDLLDGKVKNDILKRITTVADTIFREYAATDRVQQLANDIGYSQHDFLKLKINKMVTEIAKMTQARKLDPDLLDKGLAKAGIDVETFEAMAAVSFSEGGQAIGMLGPLGKRVMAYRKQNKEFAEAMDQLTMNKKTTSNNWFMKFLEGVKRVDREGRALAVIQLGTTAANITSLFAAQTLQMGANAFETTVHHLGRSFHALETGEASIAKTFTGFQNAVKDTFAPLLFLDNAQLAQEMTEYLLKYNPSIARTIDRSISGFDANTGLSKFTTFANHLNMVVDVYGRRALFAAHADKQLRRVGMSFDKLVAMNGEIPTDVLKVSAREAMKGTFAAMPRSWKQGGGALEGISYGAVRLVEALPFVPGIGTGQFPYARFTVNAIAHQLSYSPAGFAVEAVKTAGRLRDRHIASNGVTTLTQKTLRDHGKEMMEATNPIELQQARDRLGKGIVGLGLTYAGIKYAEYLDVNNENVPPTAIKSFGKDGRVADMQRFWPIGAYLATGRMLYQMAKNNDEGVPLATGVDFAEFAKNFSGVRFRTGDYTGTAEQIIKLTLEMLGPDGSLDKVAQEKLADKVGNYVGDVTGRPLTGLGFISDVLAFFDDQEAVVRDPGQIEGTGGWERFFDAVGNRYTYRIPILKQTLPKRELTTRADDRFRQDPFLRAFFGTTTYEQYTTVERELKKHNIKDFTLTINTGDKVAAGHVNKYLGPLVERELTKLVESNTYKRLSKPRQQNEILQRISGLNEIARILGETAARNIVGPSGGPTAFSRGAWVKTSSRGRAIANDVYKTMYGRDVAEQQEVEPDVDHLLNATRVAKRILRY
tara:strand:+ start:1675 stop:5304 length:3630 start_codon:yes stop_codon:yes gene_type:complete